MNRHTWTSRWIAGGLLLALLVVNLSIWRFERILRQGDVVLLELAPVDPRSLMQGDYMRLQFALAQQIDRARPPGQDAGGGYAVLQLDENRVASLLRLQSTPEVHHDGEFALRYRIRQGRAHVVTDAYFFEEGRADHFATARYGELRIGRGGVGLLAALRDAELRAL